MQQQKKMEGSVVSPSFSCYSSDSLTSIAVAKVIREQQANDFEFLSVLSDQDVSTEENDSTGRTVFPVFNRDLLVKDEEDREAKAKENELHVFSSITGSLQKLFIEEREESSLYSSWEEEESESLHSKTCCMWRLKVNGGSPSCMSKCKKSSSAGSRTKRWSIRYFFLRRSNSEGKEPMVFLTPTKVNSTKQKRNSGEVLKVGGRLKVQTPVHELFYVQRRAENEVVRRKSYLPYKQDLVGFFSNVKGMGKILPF
ncbi:uncharacterized protein LOC111895440 [Lactuca sativa]|uniref:uncharacterized protein LOC111895440 n=1 Tax=Lactuca sativa TaxID=4236 RepID=UPI000CD93038|nr:uncharacterized protein LOC111895440 [Lactuca sativa]